MDDCDEQESCPELHRNASMKCAVWVVLKCAVDYFRLYAKDRVNVVKQSTSSIETLQVIGCKETM